MFATSPACIASSESPLVTFLVRRVADLGPMFEKHVPQPFRSQLSGVVLLSHSFSHDSEAVRKFATGLKCRVFHVATLGTIGWDASAGVCCEVEQLGRGKEFGAPGPTLGGTAMTVIAVRAAPKPGDHDSRRAHLALTRSSAPKITDGAVGHVVFLSNRLQDSFFALMASPDHGVMAGGRCFNIAELVGGKWEEVDFIVLTAMDAERCCFNVSQADMLHPEPVAATTGREMLRSLPPGHKPVFLGHFQCLLKGQNLHKACNVESKGIVELVGQTVPSLGFVCVGEICNRDERNPDGWNTRLPNATKFAAGTNVLCCYAVRHAEDWAPQHIMPDPFQRLELQLQSAALPHSGHAPPTGMAWLRYALTCCRAPPKNPDGTVSEGPVPLPPNPGMAARLSQGSEGTVSEEPAPLPLTHGRAARLSHRSEGIGAAPGPRRLSAGSYAGSLAPSNAGTVVTSTGPTVRPGVGTLYKDFLRGIPKEACGVIDASCCSFWIPGSLSNADLYNKSSPVDVVDVFISQVIQPMEGCPYEMFGLLKCIDTHCGAMRIALQLSNKVDSADVQEQMSKLTFWVDRACVNQDDEEGKMNVIRNYLEDFLVNARFVLCLFSPHYLTRLWCIFEFCCALAFREDLDTIAIGATGLASDLTVARVIAGTIVNVSVKEARCFDPADRHIIEEKVSLHFHSTADFEQFAKLAALCLLARDTLSFLVDYQFMQTWELWCTTARECGFLELEAAMQSFDMAQAHLELNTMFPDTGDRTQADKRMALCSHTYVGKWFKTKVDPLIRAAREAALKEVEEELPVP